MLGNFWVWNPEKRHGWSDVKQGFSKKSAMCQSGILFDSFEKLKEEKKLIYHPKGSVSILLKP